MSWQERISQSWSGIHFGRLKVSREEARWHFQVEVYLGDVSPEDVQVELYADALPRSGRE